MNHLKSLFSILVAAAAAAIALILGSAAAEELAVSVDGVWKVNASTDSGQKHYTMTISNGEGDALSGSIVEDGKDDERKFDRVAVNGKKLTLGIDLESDGQTGVLKVDAKEENPGVLTGKWSIEDSSGTALMGGEWDATKEVVASLAGTWDTVAELPEGGTFDSALVVSGSPGDYSATFEVEEGEVSARGISEKDGKIAIDVVIEQEGVKMDVQLRCELDGNDLIGTWKLTDDSASGDWKATRRTEFVLAGDWDVLAILPEGEELQALFEIAKGDDGSHTGMGKVGDDKSELKSISISDDGEVTITLGFEMDGTAGLATITAEADGDNKLKGKWAFASDSGSENYDGEWSASRATEKRGVLRGR
ncbi:MAG: hypothetical protein ACI9R3_000505 [Verrucomicrobiales bacterium]|jgi:hypothetical protein